MAEENIREGHYREILAEIRAINGKFEAVDERLKETRDDAREARDAATKLTERFNSQDLPMRIASVASEMEKGFTAARSDLVNASDKITREMREGHTSHDKRIGELETFKTKHERYPAELEKLGKEVEGLKTFRDKLDGAKGLMGWISANAPWLASIIIGLLVAVATTLGIKEKLG